MKMEETMKDTMMEENPYRAVGEEIVRLEAEGKRQSRRTRSKFHRLDTR